MSSLTPHSALVHTMVMASAIDAEMTDSELLLIGQLIDRMPVFEDYEPDNLTADAEACAEMLAGDGGVDAAIDQIKASLPARLRETAYALAAKSSLRTAMPARRNCSFSKSYPTIWKSTRWPRRRSSAVPRPATPGCEARPDLAALADDRCQCIDIVIF